MPKRNKIPGQRTTSNGVVGPIGITVGPKTEVCVDREKKSLAGRAFEISKDAHSGIPMVLVRFVHKLCQNVY